MLKNLASSLILTELDPETDDYKRMWIDKPPFDEDSPPKIRGRVVTTLHKAKEVRPLIEKCITIARRSLEAQQKADDLNSDAERNSEEWKAWRKSDKWQEWANTIAPVLAARRRALKLLGNKWAVRVLFEKLAPRFEDRDGGYTRVLKMATPRLGDSGAQAILEFVGVRDRVAVASERPEFGDDAEEETAAVAIEEAPAEEAAPEAEDAPAEETEAKGDEGATEGDDSADEKKSE